MSNYYFKQCTTYNACIMCVYKYICIYKYVIYIIKYLFIYLPYINCIYICILNKTVYIYI